jgi:hypothetical protein
MVTKSFTFTSGMGTDEQTLVSIDPTGNLWVKMVGCRINLKALEDDANTPNLTIKRYLQDDQSTDEDAEAGTWTNATDPTVVEVGSCMFNRLYAIKGALSTAVDANATVYIEFNLLPVTR